MRQLVMFCASFSDYIQDGEKEEGTLSHSDKHIPKLIALFCACTSKGIFSEKKVTKKISI